MSSLEKAPSLPKPPACDPCKAKRVRCYPPADGQSCPRCVEKQILCKTTYVPRGRPRKSTTALQPFPQPPISASAPALDLLANPELVKHLFKCLSKLPLYRHPLFREINLDTALAAASWRLDLLHPQASVLAYCICAVCATIAFHPDIIGTDLDSPSSLSDPAHFYLGADLRVYGVYRASACRILHNWAVHVAGEARVQTEASECNALSCCLLDSLEEDVESSSRPWAASYISHVRTLMVKWPDNYPNRALWAGFMMSESIRGVMHWKPVLVTLADQLLISQGPARSLESLLEAAQKEAASPSLKYPAHFGYDCIEPLLFHSTRICREFYETVSGDFARRQPISELALRNTIEALTTMQALITFCFADIVFPDGGTFPESTDVSRQTYRPETSPPVRSCAFGMSVIFTGLVLMLHSELERRANEETESSTICELSSPSSSKPSQTPKAAQSQWTSARITFLRSQARALALSALPDVRRMLALQEFPFYGVSTMWSNIMGWAEFCVQEADQRGGISGVTGRGDVEETVQTYERIYCALQGIGYSLVSTRLNNLIERLGTHLLSYRQPKSGEMILPIFTTGSSFSLPGHDIDMELLSRPLPDMSFLLDGSWMVGGSQLEI
ncbi:hypothetical protein C8F01DRAFT_1129166 [Mycena amicta]|nr:hypothetical protein C8F01DRAFT_1129166 [Mycena amicta]